MVGLILTGRMENLGHAPNGCVVMKKNAKSKRGYIMNNEKTNIEKNTERVNNSHTNLHLGVSTKLKIAEKTIEKSNLVKKFSTGAISACIWNNESLNQNGEIVEYKTISFNRRYLDKSTNQWKSTDSFKTQDLPKAVLVLQKAYEYLALRDDFDANAIASDE